MFRARVVASPRWLLRVVARVTQVPHVFVAYAAFLRRFVEDPPATVGFLVPKHEISLSNIEIPKKRIDILQR